MAKGHKFLILLVLFCVANASQAEPVLLLTEHLPPYQIVEQDNISGSATQITQAVFQHANIDYEITASSWSDAYNLTQRNSNACLFSTSRIEERESSFVWIGQINSMGTAFYRSVNQDFTINSLEDVKAYRVAAIKDDVSHHFLLSKGFEVDKNLYVLHTYESLMDLLDRSNRNIDLVLTNPQLLEFRVKDKRKLSRYEAVMQLEELTLYHFLACNMEADRDMIVTLKNSFSELEARGELQSIRAQWGIETMQIWKSRPSGKDQDSLITSPSASPHHRTR